MAEQPPKKIGSLRDRIAAFENKGPAPAPAPAPVPRPKPSGVAWKPRPTSPPPAVEEHADNKGPGMSAADARDSITRGGGGSLRERMAALQGLSGFGGGAPAAPPPRPVSEKPKWKPPPVVPPPVEGADGESSGDAQPAGEPQPTSPPADVTQASEGEEAAQTAAESEEGETQEPDPEEEERQRRAAIAARMARLGGARVGMGGPPIFGRKPDVPPKKISTPKVEEPQEGVVESSSQHEEISPIAVQTPPAPAASESHVTDAQDDTGDAKAASTTSLLSADSGSSSAPRSPAMPVPAAPRRAAPPRRKAPKSPSPAAAPAPAVLETETVSESPAPTPLSEEDAKSQELQEDVRKSKEDEAALGIVSPTSAPESRQEVQEHEVEEKQEHIVEEKHHHVPDAEEAAYASALTDALEEQATEPEHDAEQEDEPPHNEPEAFRTIRDINDEGGVVPVAEVAAEEEDEAARRQRILERMRQQGAFNPFGAPPPAKETSTSPLEPESQSEEALHVSQTPTPVPPPVPSATRPDRRDSAASVRSAGSERHAAVDGNETNVNVNHHRMSTAERENMQTVNEEVYEEPAVEELEAEVRHDNIGDVSHEEDIPHEEAPEPPRRRSSSSYRRASYESDRSAPVPPAAIPMRRDSLRSPPPVALPSPTPTSPSVKRASLPPPRALPTIPQGVADAGPRAPSVHRTSISSVNSGTGKQVPIVPREDEAPPVPVRRPSTDSRSSRRSMPPPPPPPLLQQGEDEGEDADTGYHAPTSAPAMPPVPPPHRPSLDVRPERRSIPLPPPPPLTAPEVPSDNEDEYDERQHGSLTEEYVGRDEAGVESLVYEVEEEEVAPPPPPRRASVRVSHGSVVDHAPMSPVAVSPTRVERPSAPPAPPPAPQADSPPPDAHDDLSEQEVLDDEDGDPIDPAFYGVQRSASSVGPSHGVPAATPTAVEAEEPTAAQESAEDEESTRRRTLAERMAKLGGIRFGAPLPPVARPPPPPPAEISAGEEGLSESESAEHPAEEAPAQEEEEDEAARRQRIAARLASTGGMRFGMMPGVAPPVASPPPVPNQRPPQPDVMATPRAPPAPVARPPPPPPAEEPELESDYQSVSDGVPVEAEESEMEEVNYEDAEEPPPPPVPTREGRRVMSPVPVSQPQVPPMPPTTSRPPIPMGRPPIPGTPQTVRLSTSPPHMPPPPPPMQNDYVMVEPEAEEDAPPPPPRTTSQRRAAPPSAPPPPPPPQAAPQSYAPQASMMSRTSGVAQWENALDFGGDTDLSLSGQWSEDSTQYPPSSQIPPPPPSQAPRRASSSAGHPSSQPHVIPSQLSPDELMQQWGRVGVQIHETATTLYEKSRKSPIGDGTYIGFVAAVIKQIPNAMQPSSFDSFGYLFYEQSGPSVQKRASDIMPGDIIVLRDAKLKGHKGLQPYHQNVGVGQPVCAIVGDFEVKKAKVKVYQANQHVGQESVETVSYRLEDLKSGTVKVYRVLEA